LPDEETVARVVAESEAGMRLDQFLALQPEVGSRGRAKEIIDAGLVDVPGGLVKAGLSLDAGQEVRFARTIAPPPDRLHGDTEPPQLRTLFADDWLIVIDKQAGLSSHPPPGRRFRGPTVASAACAQFGALPTLGGDDRPGIVHRLDRDTTGVMVLARTEAAFHGLRAQFQARTVEKEYLCIAFGESRFDSDWIERPIGPDPRHPERMKVLAQGGREAATYYEVAEAFVGFTRFRCRPRTGRTHQIRVHMASIGHSLVGDRTYCGRRSQPEQLPAGAPDPGRQCLHAHRLRIQHPGTLEPMEFEAPVPADLAALLGWLRANRPRPSV
jgi:23S rRNA pseudouridine1911/1915/1917 synthase